MKICTKCILMLFILFLLTPSVFASSFTPTTIIGDSNTLEVSQEGMSCFVIPYSYDDLTWRRDIAMITDIEWSARESIPDHILEQEGLNVRYHSPEGSSSSLACIYYKEPLVTLYY